MPLAEASGWKHDGRHLSAGGFRIGPVEAPEGLEGWHTVEVRVTNKTDDRRAAQVHVALFDETGRMMAAAALKRGIDQPLGSTLPAGHSAAFRDILVVPAAQMKRAAYVSIRVSDGGTVHDRALRAPLTKSEGGQRLECAAKLRRVVFGCHLYASDNDEKLPPSLEALRPHHLPEEDMLSCSSTPGETGYVYVSGIGKIGRVGYVLIYDKKGNHEGGRNVALTGGRVVWMQEEGFQEALGGRRNTSRPRNAPKSSSPPAISRGDAFRGSAWRRGTSLSSSCALRHLVPAC
jgi:hypothetical protein